VSPVGIVHDAVEVYCFTLFDLFVNVGIVKASSSSNTAENIDYKDSFF
jgi:hypothetical protein